MTSKCNHDVRARWGYVSSELDSASGYCTKCNETFRYCYKAGHLVPAKEVKESIASRKYRKKALQAASDKYDETDPRFQVYVDGFIRAMEVL